MNSLVVGLNTTNFISLEVSYLLSELRAFIDKRTQTTHINKLETTPDELIKMVVMAIILNRFIEVLSIWKPFY